MIVRRKRRGLSHIALLALAVLTLSCNSGNEDSNGDEDPWSVWHCEDVYDKACKRTADCKQELDGLDAAARTQLFNSCKGDSSMRCIGVDHTSDTLDSCLAAIQAESCTVAAGSYQMGNPAFSHGPTLPVECNDVVTFDH